MPHYKLTGQAERDLDAIILKTAVEHIHANKNQHKLDKENCVM